MRPSWGVWLPQFGTLVGLSGCLALLAIWAHVGVEKHGKNIRHGLVWAVAQPLIAAGSFVWDMSAKGAGKDRC